MSLIAFKRFTIFVLFAKMLERCAATVFLPYFCFALRAWRVMKQVPRHFSHLPSMPSSSSFPCLSLSRGCAGALVAEARLCLATGVCVPTWAHPFPLLGASLVPVAACPVCNRNGVCPRAVDNLPLLIKLCFLMALYNPI